MNRWNFTDGLVFIIIWLKFFACNYFQNIKDLKFGDKIIYKTQYGNKTYLVNNIVIIEDTDWSYLKNTKENKITLITCVENKPTLRRCIQGLEI